MSLRTARAAIAALAALAIASSACTAERPTGVVAGMTTQMQIPRDLKYVRVLAKSSGEIFFDRSYPVYDGTVSLPATLTFAPVDGVGRGQAITITILGYAASPLDNDTGDQPVSLASKTAPQLLRRVVLNYDEGRVAYLPVRLSYSCLGVQCSKIGESCSAGKCVPDAIDVTKLPTFVDGLFEASSQGCFNATMCIPADRQIPARLANLPDITSPGSPVSAVDRCTFTVPDKDPVSGRALSIPEGAELNVRVVFGRANPSDPASLPRAEILDLGPEGFTVPDPSKPGVFRLAEGLCNAAYAASPDNLGTEVYVAPTRFCLDGACEQIPTCAAKVPSQSLCAADIAKTGPAATGGVACVERALAPSPSVLGLVVDRRDTMRGPLASAAFASVLGLPLGGTLLKRTSVALAFTPPRSGGDLCASPALSALYRSTGTFDETGANASKPILGFDWTNAGAALPKFSALQASPNLLAGPPGLTFGTQEYAAAYETFLAANPAGFDVALGAGGFYDAIRDRAAAIGAARGNLMILGTREFTGSCGGARAVAAAAAAKGDATTPTATYVLALGDSNPTIDPAPLRAAAQDLATAGGTEAFLATSRIAGDDTAKGLEALTTVAVNVATCSYERTSDVTPTSKLSYVGLARKREFVEPNPTCAGGAGWRAVGTRVELCAQSCTDYRQVVKTRGLIAAFGGATLDEVPIVVRTSCED
jgi:hypothetical protein